MHYIESRDSIDAQNRCSDSAMFVQNGVHSHRKSAEANLLRSWA